MAVFFTDAVQQNDVPYKGFFFFFSSQMTSLHS